MRACSRCGAAQPVDVPADFLCETCALADVDARVARERRDGVRMIAAGGCAIAVAAALWIVGWNPGYDSNGDSPGVFFLAAIIGIGLGASGLGAFRLRKRLRR